MTEPTAQLAATVTRLQEELTEARATIDHMAKAMSWISGHDRQGLDHLEEAQYEARSREAAVGEARRWAARARAAERALATPELPAQGGPIAAGQAEDALRARVRAAVKAAGITQVTVAERLGISQKYLSQMLTGKASLTLVWAERILALYDLRPVIGLQSVSLDQQQEQS